MHWRSTTGRRLATAVKLVDAGEPDSHQSACSAIMSGSKQARSWRERHRKTAYYEAKKLSGVTW